MTGRLTLIAIGAAAILAGAVPAAADDFPALVVTPVIIDRGAAAVVTVSGIDTRSVELRVAGERRWQALVRQSGRWSGVVLGPRLLGIYALELRSGGRVYRSKSWLLRVLARGTLARPLFATADAVAAWWVGTVRPRSVLVAIRPWRLPAGDPRDPQLHRLFVIAYSPVGDASVADRLGIWITAFRGTPGGRWRLLEATIEPPGPAVRPLGAPEEA
jgi:hypothetical protein